METSVGATRLAWGIVCVLACGFCYSIGWQTGAADATERASDQYLRMTQSLESTRPTGDEAQAAGEASAEAV